MKELSKLVLRAGVAELADAQDLGSCGLKTVEVRVLSPAPPNLLIMKACGPWARFSHCPDFVQL